MKPAYNNYFSGEKINSIVILLLFFLVSFHAATAQVAKSPVFNIKMKLTITDGDLKHAVITVTKNGAPYKVIDPGGGKYSVDLDLNAEYLFTCTKMGYITKSVVVDAHVPNGREQEEFARFSATVILNKQPEESEITYTQPVGRIKYAVESGDFDYDKDYSASATEMQRKAEANPIPRPKSPTPNPRPAYTPPVQPTLGPSNPIPVDVKQPAYVPEPPKKKKIEIVPEIPPKPIVKTKTEKNFQRDRVTVTIITVNINGMDYEYSREAYAWGGTFYYKNGRNVTPSCFDKETE